MYQDEIAREIGKRVRAGRGRLGMTRKQLSLSADVSERYLNELENGEANASIGILTKIAAALGEDFTRLVVGDGARPAHTNHSDAELGDLIASLSHIELEAARGLIQRYLEERRRSLKGVALFGLRGAGKTTLGRLLAEKHGVAFVSITREIEARAGMTLADLFNLGGADSYRGLENDVVADLMQRDDRIVLETAGGIVGNTDALEAIHTGYKTIWLKASPEDHLERVASQGDLRPMRGNPKALDHVKALLAQRAPEYARAEHALDTAGRSIQACLAELDAIGGRVLSVEMAS